MSVLSDNNAKSDCATKPYYILVTYLNSNVYGFVSF